MNKKNYAKRARALVSARKAQPNTAETVEVNLDGFEFIGRRLDLQSWIKGGRIPQRLTEQMIRIHKGEQAQIIEEQLTADDQIAALRFQRSAICEAIVRPHIVNDGDPLMDEEDIYFSELFADCPDLIDKVMQWILAGSPGIPVKLDDGGETTLEALDTFREDAGESVGAGADVPDVRDGAKPSTPVVG